VLVKRTITAILLFCVLLLVLWSNQFFPSFTITVSLCALICGFEFFRMVSSSGKGRPATWLGLVLIILFVFSPIFNWLEDNSLIYGLVLVLPLIWVLLRRDKSGALTGWAFTIAGILYLGWTASRYTSLIQLDHGQNWIIFALFCAFASDTLAYVVGRLMGKHKLAPTISPAKTWEGAIGGFIGAIIIGSITAWILELPLSFWQAIILTGITSIFVQFGDLAESLFKRNLSLKDSGTALPGHGGLLDRVDGIIFAGVVVYYYVVWIV